MLQKIKNKTISKIFGALALSALLVGSIGSVATSAFAAPGDVTTLPATTITTTDATMNGLNGPTDAAGHSFWISTSTFSTASPSLPAGVFSTADLGAIASSTAFSAAASSVSGLGVITPNTQYFYAAWSDVGGTWAPGEVLSFTTLPLLSTDSSLSNLTISSGSLSPVFSASTTSYTDSVVNGITSVTVTPTSNQAGATIKVNGTPVVSGTVSTPITLNVGGNTILSVVTAQDASTTSTYTITVTRALAATTTSFVTTSAATGITSTDAALNGVNGSTNASGHSIWVSTSTFSTASPTIPAGVYSTVDFGAIASSTAFSASLSSATGIPAITPNTTYYFAAWSNVAGTWHPGSIMTLTTGAVGTTTGTTTVGTIGGTVTDASLHVTSVDTIKNSAIADGTFANGWEYVFHITAPTNETKLSMKFSDWTSLVGSSTIPAANNIRISSPQADNAGATVLITAANTYSTPVLNMNSDADAGTAGRQVDVTVETAVPLNSVNGSYTTSYGVQTVQ